MPISRSHLEKNDNILFFALNVTSDFVLLSSPKRSQPKFQTLPEVAGGFGCCPSDAAVDRVGHIYASLADEDVYLAEMGLAEYARLLDIELVNDR